MGGKSPYPFILVFRPAPASGALGAAHAASDPTAQGPGATEVQMVERSMELYRMASDLPVTCHLSWNAIYLKRTWGRRER